MDQLKNDCGFTLVETLVSMLILGIVITLTVLFTNIFFSNPNVLFRTEALNLAKTEMSNTVVNRLISDTTYTSLNGNLFVERKMVVGEVISTVNIVVIHKPTNRTIVELEKKFRNEF